ncbi:hypothetical protein KR044_009768 [Drosophila immigrans]|nr:hypothetical protein KR044_009768 [Drosophila immigrans]
MLQPLHCPGSTDVETAPFVKVGDGYYYFEPSTTASWYTAFETCRRMNATLVSFDTMQKWNDVANFLNLYNSRSTYWTSGSNQADKTKHVWFGTGNPININIWGQGLPNTGTTYCYTLSANTGQIRVLSTATCLTKFLFICEAPKLLTASFIVWK